VNDEHPADRNDDKATLLSRGDFLACVGGVLLTGASAGTRVVAGIAPAGQPHRWKGRRESSIKRWDVITIGNLSRNRYWGESDARAVRSAICTCTLITGERFRLLVDPSLADEAEMAREVDRRTGIRLEDVTDVFITHEHGDHYAGMAHFRRARWWTASAVAETLNQSGKLPRRIEGAAARLFDAIDVIHTPGHTRTHHSLRFDCDGLSIVIAGDAVATRDFFRARQGYFNAVDFALSARTMDRLAVMADIIVPGHDNYYLADCVERGA